MDSGFCVKNSLLELRKKGLFGAVLIWPSNIRGVAINVHFSLKEVGNVDTVKQVEYGVDYHVFCMKDPYCLMKLMTTYGTLEPTDKRTRRKFKCGGVMETK